MNIKTIIAIFCLITGLSISLNAQFQDVNLKKDPSSFGQRVFFGGNLGLQLGTITSIEVSPLMGYRLTERWIAGVGITYMYYEDKRYSPTYSTNIYGGRLFTRYYLFGDFFAHAEYELLSYEQMTYLSWEKTRRNVSSYLIGGGYRQWLGASAAVNLMVLFNLNDTEYSVYNNPIFRIGFEFGL